MSFSPPEISFGRVVSVRGSQARIGLLASGAVQTAPLIAARYPLEDAVAALEHARRPGVLKVLLTIQ